MRAFLGFSVADGLALELMDLRDRAVSTLAGAGPKPVIAANFHMTLTFLGDIDTERAAEIGVRMDSLAPQLQPCQVQFRHAHCFPDATSPIFAVEAPLNEGLSRLQRRVLRTLGQPEAQPLRPHITLARLRRAYVPAPRWPVDLAFAATELCLYESVQSQWGVRYRPIRRWVLG